MRPLNPTRSSPKTSPKSSVKRPKLELAFACTHAFSFIDITLHRAPACASLATEADQIEDDGVVVNWETLPRLVPDHIVAKASLAKMKADIKEYMESHQEGTVLIQVDANLYLSSSPMHL